MKCLWSASKCLQSPCLGGPLTLTPSYKTRGLDSFHLCCAPAQLNIPAWQFRLLAKTDTLDLTANWNRNFLAPTYILSYTEAVGRLPEPAAVTTSWPSPVANPQSCCLAHVRQQPDWLVLRCFRLTPHIFTSFGSPCHWYCRCCQVLLRLRPVSSAPSCFAARDVNLSHKPKMWCREADKIRMSFQARPLIQSRLQILFREGQFPWAGTAAFSLCRAQGESRLLRVCLPLQSLSRRAGSAGCKTGACLWEACLKGRALLCCKGR